MSTTLIFDSRSIAHSPNFGDVAVPFIRQVDHQRCYELGFSLGLQDRDAEPPADWTFEEKSAFLDGLSWGLLECDAVRRDAFEADLARQEEFTAETERLQAGYVGY